MDLAFPRFEPGGEVVVLPPDLAMLMVAIAARQAASPTALASGRLPIVAEAARLAPLHGAFNAPVAQLIAGWRDVNLPFTEPL